MTPNGPASPPPPKLSVVIPIFNEREVIPALSARVNDALSRIDGACEIVFVDDGSSDGSPELLREAYEAERPANVSATIVSLSRNFGQQPAIMAGLETATGDCVAVMDADLQDPPDLIGRLYEKWREGHLVVLPQPARRRERLARRIQHRLFYRILGFMADVPLTLDVGVFGLLDRRVVSALLKLPERNRFLPGLRSWLGFEPCLIPYERPERVAGEPKQTFGRLLRYALDSIVAFSYKPLRFGWMLGMAVSILCFVYAIVLTLLRLLDVNVVRGFTTPTVAILFLGGVQLFMIGVLGEYIGRIYDEVKGRPHFVVRGVWQSGSPPGGSRGAG